MGFRPPQRWLNLIKRGAVQGALTALGLNTTIQVVTFQKVKKLSNRGFSLKLRLLPGIDFKTLEKQAGKLAVALKRENVSFKKLGKNIVLMIADNGFPDGKPTYPGEVNENFIPVKKNNLPIGMDIYGNENYLPIFSEVGGSTTLIGGNPGFGKSSLIKILFLGLSETNTALFWLDAKYGADANEFKIRSEVLDNPKKSELFLEFIVKLNQLIDERNNFRGLGKDITVLRRVVVFIDEWAVLANSGSRQIQSEFAKELKSLISVCRTAYVSVVLATQRPTKENVDTTSKELANNRISFQVMDKYASEAILGVAGAEQGTTDLPRGVCLMTDGATLRKVSIFGVPEGMSNYIEQFSGFKITIDELLEENRIFAREHGVLL